MRTSTLGPIVLLAKLGPKLFPILVKMGDALWSVAKSMLGIKSVGLVGSVGLYTYLFTWQMAIALVIFIGIHEYGHLWAMKRCGIRTKGMFFLPGLGAVAVAEERFRSARNEAYIAIMGPIFGLVFFVFPMMLIYWKTGDAMYAAIGAIMAFINLVNLFPINPLDGGRILKALAYSERQAASLAITVVVSVATAVLGTAAGFFLLAYMAIIGLWDIAVEFGIKEHVRAFLMTLARGAAAVMAVWVAQILAKELSQEESSLFLLSFYGTVLTSIALAAVFDVKASTVDKCRSVLMYPIAVLGELWKGAKQILNLRAEDIQPIENYARMSGVGKAWYALSFIVLTLIHVVVIHILGRVPGAELAKELMQ
jgi:Zn-dependent protease